MRSYLGTALVMVQSGKGVLVAYNVMNHIHNVRDHNSNHGCEFRPLLNDLTSREINFEHQKRPM